MNIHSVVHVQINFIFHIYIPIRLDDFIKLCCYLSCIDTIGDLHTFSAQMPKMYDFHWSNAKYLNPSRDHPSYTTTPM